MNLHATKLAKDADSDAGPSDAPAPAAPLGRFTYASGSKPLQGYTLKRGIGHGGFGEVYYATSDAGKEVALKLIRRNWDVELRGVNHCLNLKHPNLLALYDVRQDANDDNWVVMELMSGESLEDVLQRSPDGLPVDEALAWMHGLAAGVAYLHDHGIVHRDLKPGNVFVDEGIIKIGDYGLSKFISCSRRSGQTGSVGTVHYMAPEVANGRYGKEIDIYALGIILYEMLTGHVPFEGESVGEILMKHLTAEADVSGLSEPYRTIVARALAKDPSKRFSSIDEMLAMLPAAPTGAALTASARFAGPNPVVAQRAALAAAEFSHRSPDGNLNANAASPIQPVVSANGISPLDNLRPDSPPPLPKSLPEEPVLRWMHQSWSDLAAWWERMNFQPWQKLLILFGAGYTAFSFFPLWVPMLIGGGMIYGFYRLARLFVDPRPSTSSATNALGQVGQQTPLPLGWLAPILSPAVFLGFLVSQTPSARNSGEMTIAMFCLGAPLALLGLGALRRRWLRTATLLVCFSLGATGTLAALYVVDARELLRDPDNWMAMFPAGLGTAFLGFLAMSAFGLQRVGIHRWLPQAVVGEPQDQPARPDIRRHSTSQMRLRTRGEIVGVLFITVAMGLLMVRFAFGFFTIDSSQRNDWAIGVPTAGILVVCGYLFSRLLRRSSAQSDLDQNAIDAEGSPLASELVNRNEVARAKLAESRTRHRWRQHSTMAHYNPGTPRERVAKLLESLLTSAAVVAVMSLVDGILRGSALELSQYAWLATTSLLGSWAILLPAKLWEGKQVDNAVRRFVLLVLGLAVGLASFGVMDWLMVSLTFDTSIADLSKEGFTQHLRTDFFGPDGTPKLIALLAYYGFVLVAMRWWKLADPMRNTRLSLWAVAVAVFWSYVVNLFFPFPQPWGMMTVATIAVAVQMASPCISKRATNRSYD